MITQTCRYWKSKQYNEVEELDTHLLVEDPVLLVDICDVALVFVDALAMELLLLLDAGEQGEWKVLGTKPLVRTLC